MFFKKQLENISKEQEILNDLTDLKRGLIEFIEIFFKKTAINNQTTRREPKRRQVTQKELCRMQHKTNGQNQKEVKQHARVQRPNVSLVRGIEEERTWEENGKLFFKLKGLRLNW